MVTLPRLVVAAPASSAGKTTIATGVMAALRASGLDVAGFKVGPDFIDPGFHTLATGRPGRNLDPVLTSEALIPRLLLHGARVPRPARVAIVEGVMGLFDGRLGGDGFGSSAHVARLIGAPVVLVVDAAGSSRTVAAAASGLRAFDPALDIAGVVVNRVASPRHEAELRATFARCGLPVLGVVPRSSSIVAPSRHLGLVPAAELREAGAIVDALAAHIAAHVDLDALLAVADRAPALDAEPWDPASAVTPVAGRPRVGLMTGRAFTFRYPETAELLVAAGCVLAEIDPLADAALPADLAGLYIGGGFPEEHAPQLSANASLRAAVGQAIADGLPTIAECAGQLYLARSLDGLPMVGAVDADARMTPRLTLGYRAATAPADTLAAARGTRVTGHDFHRTVTEPGAGVQAAWSVDGRLEGFSSGPGGRASLHASYLHVHWAGHPGVAQRFADASAAFVAGGPAVPAVPAAPTLPPGPRVGGARSGVDLVHHGDRDAVDGLIDLAVNVMSPGPPPWLAEAIAASQAELGRYPDAGAARAALAARHGVAPSMVLATAGAADAFTLVARTLTARHPLVVHPQFTAPEAALRACGHAVQRWVLPVGVGSGTPPLGDLPGWADAVFVGNPNNPTGWLHARDDLRALERPLVVDEAFMDAADERETLISPHMPDLLVVRSLSKTWGIPGVRAGYVVGDPAWIARLASAQPPWPLSAQALAVMVATSTPHALAEARRLYAALPRRRAHLVSALAESGFGTPTSDAPFVLVDTSACGAASVRAGLAQAGFAVRRGETFPGLSENWIRVRVPEEPVSDALVAALCAWRVES